MATTSTTTIAIPARNTILTRTPCLHALPVPLLTGAFLLLALVRSLPLNVSTSAAAAAAAAAAACCCCCCCCSTQGMAAARRAILRGSPGHAHAGA
eukprot:15449279-Alexandrium_andersonii.AAC.1